MKYSPFSDGGILDFELDDYDFEANRGCQPVHLAYKDEISSGVSPRNAKLKINLDYKWRYIYGFLYQKLREKLDQLEGNNKEYDQLLEEEREIDSRMSKYSYVFALARNDLYDPNVPKEEQDKTVAELINIKNKIAEKIEIPALKGIIAENIDHPKVQQFLTARRNGERTVYYCNNPLYFDNTISKAADEFNAERELKDEDEPENN